MVTLSLIIAVRAFDIMSSSTGDRSGTVGLRKGLKLMLNRLPKARAAFAIAILTAASSILFHLSGDELRTDEQLRKVRAARTPLKKHVATGKRYSVSTPVRLRAGPMAEAGLRRLASSAEANLQVHASADGRLRYAGGFRSRTLAGSPRQAAQEFLEENRDLLGVSAGLPLALEARGDSAFRELRFVRFQQHVNGVPVLGSEVTVGIDGENRVFQVGSSYIPDLAAAGGWQMDNRQAVALARQWRPAVPRGEATAAKVWVPGAGGNLRPAWRVLLPVRKPRADWAIVIDAADGRLLSIRNLIRGAGESLAYLKNPVLETAPQRVHLENLSGGRTLSGQYAKVYSSVGALVALLTGQTPTEIFGQYARPDGNGNFIYSPSEDPRFEEAQLYHNLDRVHARFKALGFNGLDRALEGVVYDLDAIEQGPFYSPLEFSGRGGVFFGPLPPRFQDPTWDADAIFHEYTHAVVNAIVGVDETDEFGALNEAYGDYFSATFQGDPDVGEFAGPLFGSRFPFLRTVDNPNIFPRDLFDEIHQASLIWSGALWDLRGRLGESRSDAIALAGLTGLSGSDGFVTAAMKTVAAAKTLYGDSVAAGVTAVFAARGILSAEGLAAFLATPLTSGVSQTGTMDAAPAGACVLAVAQQQSIRVPPQAESLSVVAAGQTTIQLFVRFRRPVTVEGGSVQSDYETDGGTQVGGVIDYSLVPELQAGTYYLAIAHCSTAPFQFAVEADVAGGSTGAAPVVTALNSGAQSLGSIPPGPFLNSRQFVIDVPDSATELDIALEGSTDVDLYANFNGAIVLGPQGFPLALASSESDGSDEVLKLTRFTQPELRPGRYFIGVLNFDTANVATFGVTATIVSGTAQNIVVVPVASGASTDLSLPAAAAGVGVLGDRQLKIDVPQNGSAMKLDVSTGLNANLYVRREAQVEVRNGLVVADHIFRTGSALKSFSVTLSSTPPLRPGSYFIAVGNFSAQSGTATISAAVEQIQAGNPAIASGGVVLSTGTPVVGKGSPNAIGSVFGADFAPAGTSALSAELTAAGRISTTLANTCVEVNGTRAPLFAVTPAQINFQFPHQVPAGSASVRVIRGCGTGSEQASAPETASVSAASPAFFNFVNNADGRNPIAATHGGGPALVGSPRLFQGVTTTPAQPGEFISLFGTGFGVTNPAFESGQIPGVAAPLSAALSITVGGIPLGIADVFYAGAAPCCAGLYQLVVMVPQSAPDGDLPIIATVNGVSTPSGPYITVKR